MVPIPLALLPLQTVDINQYSDRPYWFYENKYIAAAAITAADSQLYGLTLTNFGCGPNSFMLHLVEDIMGGKPLGQLEIDEHAAEAGLVTRLEAYVDTIVGFARSGRKLAQVAPATIYRASPTLTDMKKTFIIPQMAPHLKVLQAILEASGLNTILLPEANERNLYYADRVTSGVECLPYRVTLGDYMRYCFDDSHNLENVEALMAGAYGPCRLGKYALEQRRVLQNAGIDILVRTSVSNNAYRDIKISPGVARVGWRAGVAVDYLQKLLWRTRPYEKKTGEAERLFDEYVDRIADRVRGKQECKDLIRQATAEFRSLIDPALPRRPLVGINGEIFLRSNRFSNQDMVKVCEDAGLEVVVSPMIKWMNYISYRHVEDALRDHKLMKAITSYVLKRVQEHEEHVVAKYFAELLPEKEPSTEDLLNCTSPWFSPRCGSEAVLSIGSGIDWMENPEYAGVISVMPHGCMPGGIVAALSEKFSTVYGKPWINLTYDGFMETTNLTRINNFAEIIKFCNKERKPQQFKH